MTVIFGTNDKNNKNERHSRTEKQKYLFCLWVSNKPSGHEENRFIIINVVKAFYTKLRSYKILCIFNKNKLYPGLIDVG